MNQGTPETEPISHDHGYMTKDQQKKNHQKTDHPYASYQEKEGYTQDQQYADDVGWVTTNKTHAKEISENIPDLLKKRNLHINADKTEKYIVKKGGSEKWKRCKYLRSLLDTTSDFQSRKGLAYDAYNKLKALINHKNASTSNKIRRLNAFVSTIFLYNSELWTLTSKLKDKIDVLQRIFLRKCLKISRKDRITNEEVYERTSTKPWSMTIKARRLRFLGHILRLDPETPAREALKEYLIPVEQDPGRPPLNWWNTIIQDLKSIGIDDFSLSNLIPLAEDREGWKTLVRCVMSI